MERESPHPGLEIEGKFEVYSPAVITRRLQALPFSYTGRVVQRDVYYTSPCRDFGESDEALRVRYEGTEVILTYKGPKLRAHGLKAREEVNIPVPSGKDLEVLLERLGFIPAFTVEKRRERYDGDGVEISLDEVTGLGTFIEIELKEVHDRPEEKIEAIKKELGITGEHIPLSYLELLRLKQNADQSGYPSPPH
jgi:adenylyl cyclase CyaB, putative